MVGYGSFRDSRLRIGPDRRDIHVDAETVRALYNWDGSHNNFRVCYGWGVCFDTLERVGHGLVVWVATHRSFGLEHHFRIGV